MMKLYAVPRAPSIFDAAHTPRLIYHSHAVLDNEGRARAMHQHADIVELTLICAGEGLHRIGEQTYHTRAGDLLAINAGTLHDERALQDTVELYCCGFEGLQLKGLQAGLLAAGTGQVQLPCGEQFGEVLAIERLLESTLKARAPYAGELAQHLAASLVVLVRQLAQSRAAHDGGGAPDRVGAIVRAMRAYIDGHYAEDFSLDELAARFGVSRFYAAHLFREQTGYSMTQYRLRRRMGEAQSLLTTTDYSITFIAGAVGYDNPNHFTQRFTKMVGMPPKRFRETSQVPNR